MMRHLHLSSILVLCPLVCLRLLLGEAHAVGFTVVDGKASQEISETSRLYIDGALVGTFRLDDRTTQTSMPVDVPDVAGQGTAHQYVLCGEITIRNHAGTPEIHEVSGQGLLHQPEGRVFAALSAGNFSLFYLADPTDPTAVEIQPGRSSFCAAPVS
ncbi:MAG: hypothetical protein ACRYGI_04655 [Janthinobacterium lividum]